MKFYSIKKYIFIAAQLLLLSTTSGCFGRSDGTSGEPSAEPSKPSALPTRQPGQSNETEEETKKREAEAAKKAADAAAQLAKEQADKEEKIAAVTVIIDKIGEDFASFEGLQDYLKDGLKDQPDFLEALYNNSIKTDEYKNLEVANREYNEYYEEGTDAIQIEIGNYEEAIQYKNSLEGQKQLAAYDALDKQAVEAKNKLVAELERIFQNGKIQLQDGSELTYKKGDDIYAISQSIIQLKSHDDKQLFSTALELLETKRKAYYDRQVFKGKLLPQLKNFIADAWTFDRTTFNNLAAAKDAYLAWWEDQKPK